MARIKISFFPAPDEEGERQRGTHVLIDSPKLDEVVESLQADYQGDLRGLLTDALASGLYYAPFLTREMVEKVKGAIYG